MKLVLLVLVGLGLAGCCGIYIADDGTEHSLCETQKLHVPPRPSYSTEEPDYIVRQRELATTLQNNAEESDKRLKNQMVEQRKREALAKPMLLGLKNKFSKCLADYATELARLSTETADIVATTAIASCDNAREEFSAATVASGGFPIGGPDFRAELLPNIVAIVVMVRARDEAARRAPRTAPGDRQGI